MSLRDDIAERTYTLAEMVAKKQEQILCETLLKNLATDDHFLKWFRKHYDFYLQLSKESKTEKEGMWTVTTRYAPVGPTWIPLKKRIRRKIMEFIHHLRWSR